jgi:CRISPR-associated protein Csa2
MYLSFSLRVLLDAEALNMVESVGNYTRHRRAPLVIVERGGYLIRYVPAISGEALAHGYQAALAELATAAGLPVCDSCRRGEFLKHDTDAHFGNQQWEQRVTMLAKEGKLHEAEKTLIENCVVEDVGGFLYTDGGVRRTSKVYFGYALPARDFYQASAIEPQFHVRHAPTILQQEKQKEKKTKEKDVGEGEEGTVRGQMIYYVETGSAVYAISGLLELSNIGVTTFEKREEVKDAEKRREIALKALLHMLDNQLYGAKRSRFLPAWTVTSAVFALSKHIPFMVTTAHVKNYITETAERASKYAGLFGDNEWIKVWYYVREGYEPDPKPHNAIRLPSIIDLYKAVKEAAGWRQ